MRPSSDDVKDQEQQLCMRLNSNGMLCVKKMLWTGNSAVNASLIIGPIYTITAASKAVMRDRASPNSQRTPNDSTSPVKAHC